MAFDGIVTQAMTAELGRSLTMGKIGKIYQPGQDELVINVYTKEGAMWLYATCESSSACVRLIPENLPNPPQPQAFCMLLRKHLSGGRISSVEQRASERIIEILIETRNELGFSVTKKLVFEIMGKHSNILLIDIETGRILDLLKRVSPDVNRARQLLPGKPYEYPPVQDKIPYKEASEADLAGAGDTGKAILSKIGGISPALADQLAETPDRNAFLSDIQEQIDRLSFVPRVYVDNEGMPREFHIVPLDQFESSCEVLTFPTLSLCAGFFFEHRQSSNRIKQASRELDRKVRSLLDKAYLKKQRLEEDLISARDSDDMKLFGELLTANMHNITQGMKEVTVINYYDDSRVTIPLDPRYSPNKNAQNYFRKYSKAKTAVVEKTQQLAQNQENIDYLESVLAMLENAESVNDISSLKKELEDTGFIRKKKTRGKLEKQGKPSPLEYRTSDGFRVLVGRNNRENDHLTLKMAARTDYWLHTKDIPGSHVIVFTDGREITEEALFEAAAIAAWHSKARDSANVPVDYTLVKHVKKPSGAKPGMVIFTDNRTLYVTPGIPASV